MEISQGRAFVKEPDPEESPAFIINEEAARIMGLKEPVGQWLSGDAISKGRSSGSSRTITSPRFEGKSIRSSLDLLSPAVPDPVRQDRRRRRPADARRHRDRLEEIRPNSEFRFRFLDEALDSLYRSEERIGTIFRCFAALAVIISCLGLFGLASFMAEQRTREIGIRKVLGASISGIVGLFSKEFTKWVLAANLLAWPAAYFAVAKWLQGYAFRIKIGVGPFLSAAVLSTLIALLTVSYHSLRSARANPAEAIRYE